VPVMRCVRWQGRQHAMVSRCPGLAFFIGIPSPQNGQSKWPIVEPLEVLQLRFAQQAHETFAQRHLGAGRQRANEALQLEGIFERRAFEVVEQLSHRVMVTMQAHFELRQKLLSDGVPVETRLEGFPALRTHLSSTIDVWGLGTVVGEKR
jgi:hypothetical protein